MGSDEGQKHVEFVNWWDHFKHHTNETNRTVKWNTSNVLFNFVPTCWRKLLFSFWNLDIDLICSFFLNHLCTHFFSMNLSTLSQTWIPAAVSLSLRKWTTRGFEMIISQTLTLLHTGRKKQNNKRTKRWNRLHLRTAPVEHKRRKKEKVLTNKTLFCIKRINLSYILMMTEWVWPRPALSVLACWTVWALYDSQPRHVRDDDSRWLNIHVVIVDSRNWITFIYDKWS